MRRVIVHAQEPKLGPHKAAVRANLARLLGVDPGAVNVKAKTGEHVGPVGRAPKAISSQMPSCPARTRRPDRLSRAPIFSETHSRGYRR